MILQWANVPISPGIQSGRRIHFQKSTMPNLQLYSIGLGLILHRIASKLWINGDHFLEMPSIINYREFIFKY
jgi:hypothetical protein